MKKSYFSTNVWVLNVTNGHCSLVIDHRKWESRIAFLKGEKCMFRTLNYCYFLIWSLDLQSNKLKKWTENIIEVKETCQKGQKRILWVCISKGSRSQGWINLDKMIVDNIFCGSIFWSPLCFARKEVILPKLVFLMK